MFGVGTSLPATNRYQCPSHDLVHASRYSAPSLAALPSASLFTSDSHPQLHTRSPPPLSHSAVSPFTNRLHFSPCSQVASVVEAASGAVGGKAATLRRTSSSTMSIAPSPLLAGQRSVERAAQQLLERRTTQGLISRESGATLLLSPSAGNVLDRLQPNRNEWHPAIPRAHRADDNSDSWQTFSLAPDKSQEVKHNDLRRSSSARSCASDDDDGSAPRDATSSSRVDTTHDSLDLFRWPSLRGMPREDQLETCDDRLRQAADMDDPLFCGIVVEPPLAVQNSAVGASPRHKSPLGSLHTGHLHQEYSSEHHRTTSGEHRRHLRSESADETSWIERMIDEPSIINGDDSATPSCQASVEEHEEDTLGTSPLHERPMSLLLRRRSSPFPRLDAHNLPDAHLDVVEHSDGGLVPAPATSSPGHQTQVAIGIAEEDPKKTTGYYFPASPEVEKEYPASLMLWRRRASQRALAAPSSQVLTTAASSRHSPTRHEPGAYRTCTEKALSYGGFPHPAAAADDMSPCGISAVRYDPSFPASSAAPHHGGAYGNQVAAAPLHSQDASLLSKSVVSDILHQWIDGEPAHRRLFVGGHHNAASGVAKNVRVRTDQEMLRDHRNEMKNLCDGGTKYHLNTTFKLDQQLQQCRQEGQYRRGRLAAMNWATEARLAASKRVALEVGISNLLSQESAGRSEVHTAWMYRFERLHRELLSAYFAKKQHAVSQAEACARQIIIAAFLSALRSLRDSMEQHRMVSQTLEQLRCSLSNVQHSWEPTSRTDVALAEAHERNLIRQMASHSHFLVVLLEFIRDEQRGRDVLSTAASDGMDRMREESTLSSASARSEEARRLADERFQQGVVLLLRNENEDRLDCEAEERRESRSAVAALERRVLFTRERHAIENEAMDGRRNVEDNEAQQWGHMIVDYERGMDVATQRELTRLCFELRAGILRRETEERHELEVAERKGLWESEEAYRRRIDAETVALRHEQRHSRETFENHAVNLVQVFRVEETDERESILHLFEAELAELHNREQHDAFRKFLDHQAEQQQTLASMECDFRLDIIESETSLRFSRLQRQYRDELVQSRLFESERTMRGAIADQERAVYAMDIESEIEASRLAALERQRLREGREADAARCAALRLKATTSAPFLGFSLAEKIASSSADKRLVNAAGIATLVVDSLIIGGPAFSCGLRLHDRIVTVGKGVQPTSLVAVRQAIAKGAAPGDVFEIVIKRQRRNTSVGRTARGEVELDEDGHTARSSASLEVDYDDDAISETSSSSLQNSPGGRADRFETITFNVPVKTVSTEFASLVDLFFDLRDAQRIERHAPTPGYVTRSKKVFAEKAAGVMPTTRPRAATLTSGMATPSSPMLNSKSIAAVVGSVLATPSPSETSPLLDLVRVATAVPQRRGSTESDEES